MSQKITLEYDITDIYVAKEVVRAMKATDAYLVIHQLQDVLTRRISEDDLSKKETRLLAEVLTEINELLEHYGINLNDLP